MTNILEVYPKVSLRVVHYHLCCTIAIFMLFSSIMSGQNIINKNKFSNTEFIYKVDLIHIPKENIKGRSDEDIKIELGDIKYIGICLAPINIDGPDLVNTFYYYYDDKYNLLSQSAALSEITDSSIWLHPPRSGAFEILEFCPFIYVKSDKISWEWGIIISDEWINNAFISNNFVNPDPDLRQKYLYELKEDISFIYDGSLYKCKEIVARSILPVFNSEARFLFSNEIGFPHILFRFSDVYIVTLDLKKIKTY